MKTTFFAATLTAFFIANVQANTVGLYLGGQFWQSDVTGTLGEENTLTDFDLKNVQQSNYFIAVEHPYPLLPNIRIASTKLDTTGKTHLTKEFSDDNETSHVDVQVASDIDANFNVSYIDYTLYYELFANSLFSFDLGLTARDFGGHVAEKDTANIVTTTRDRIWDGEDHDEHDYHNITETTKTVTTDKIKTNDIEPMLYVATNISLPLTGLSIFGQGDILLKNHHSLYDYQIGLSYDLIDSRKVDLNLTLGYRTVNMELENLESLYKAVKFKGAFAGVILHF